MSDVPSLAVLAKITQNLMANSPITELPDGYTEVQHLVLTDPRRLLRLNLYGIAALIAALLLMAGYWSLIAPLRPSNAPASAPLPDVAMILLVLLITLPLHELLHGVAIRWVGHKPKYGMNLEKGILFATADKALFRRDEYIMVALAPLVLITLAVLLLQWVVADGLVYWLSLAAVLNGSGAVGDMWSVWMLLRHPRSVIVRDEADGFRVYGRQTANL